MTIYTSRYANPELKTGNYTTARISLGTPKWNLGYAINATMPDLMPFGLLGKYEKYEPFAREYHEALDRKDVNRIAAQLQTFKSWGKYVVLLCYEDVRIPDVWCHRRAFAEWWEENTGEQILELPDPSTPKVKRVSVAQRAVLSRDGDNSSPEQISLF